MRVDVTAVSPQYENDHDFGEFFTREIIKRLRLTMTDDELRKRRMFDIGEVMENFHPWSALRLLAENGKNLDVPVTWSFADVVEDGWVERANVVHELRPDVRYLIVTEGSSDAKILGHALNLLRPEIADFFRFVDMEEGYPFTGTGNLHKFCQGLVSIGVQNRVLIVYDNDAEGTAKFAATRKLTLPPNMRVMKLPDLSVFEQFDTLGPNGCGSGDINRRAAAIECYLDFASISSEKPYVRWTNYNREIGAYHGELLHKEEYARQFLNLRFRDPDYDFSKVELVLDAIIAECVSLAFEVECHQGRP